jgi:hypothetical protein
MFFLKLFFFYSFLFTTSQHHPPPHTTPGTSRPPAQPHTITCHHEQAHYRAAEGSKGQVKQKQGS